MKIIHSPLKKIIIHQLEKHDLKSFIDEVLNREVSQVGWCKGYLILFRNYDDVLLQEIEIKGTRHIQSVIYCKMDTFQETIRNERLNHEVLIIKQEHDEVIRKIVEFLDIK